MLAVSCSYTNLILSVRGLNVTLQVKMNKYAHYFECNKICFILSVMASLLLICIVYVHVYACYMYIGASEAQKKSPDLLELEL